jgi:hypothetical protein
LGVTARAAAETLPLLDEQLEVLVLSWIKQDPAEKAHPAKRTTANRDDALGPDDLTRTVAEDLRGQHIAEIGDKKFVAVARPHRYAELLWAGIGVALFKCPAAHHRLAGGPDPAEHLELRVCRWVQQIVDGDPRDEGSNHLRIFDEFKALGREKILKPLKQEHGLVFPTD